MSTTVIYVSHHTTKMISDSELRALGSWLIRAPRRAKTLKQSEENENSWGSSLTEKWLETARPDIVFKKGSAWSGKLGQLLIEELFPDGWKPTRKGGHLPDWETKDYIIEAKAQTWYTAGTAGEKIYGVPVKYRNIPDLYEKPLIIVCFGRAESVWFGLPKDEKLMKIINFWESMNIRYVKGSSLLFTETV